MPADNILHSYRRTHLKPHKGLIITHYNQICPWDGNEPSLVFRLKHSLCSNTYRIVKSVWSNLDTNMCAEDAVLRLLWKRGFVIVSK
jgi:hypothetical protein